MSIISKQLSGFLFNASAVALASAGWKNNVRAIYGFNPAGNGYTVFKPANLFNSLTQLEPNGSYILDAATTGFELPGAALAAVTGGMRSSTLFITDPDVRPVGNGEYELSFEIRSTEANPDSRMCVLTVDDDPNFTVMSSSGGGALVNVWGLAPGSTHELKVSDSSGNADKKAFAIPQ
jgi:hypothetical protein